METNNIIARMQAEIDAANAECVRLAEALEHVQGENGKLMGEIAALNIEQAEARGAALEEAALACENERLDEGSESDGDRGYDMAIKHVAAAIRAIKAAPPAKTQGTEAARPTLSMFATMHDCNAARAKYEAGNPAASEVPPLPAPAEQKQTTVSKRLREIAGDSGVPKEFRTSMMSKELLSKAADEIDHYYTGMLNWKACAEAKDRAPASSKAAEGSIGDDRKFCRLARAWDAADHTDGPDPIEKWEAFVAYTDSVILARIAAVGAPGDQAFLHAAKDFAQAHINCDEAESLYESDPNSGSEADTAELDGMYNVTKKRLVEAYRSITAQVSGRVGAQSGKQPVEEL